MITILSIVLSFFLLGVVALLVIKPIAQMRTHRRVEEMAIVGSGLMARKLLHEFTDQSEAMCHAVQYDEIGKLPQQRSFSKIVLVDRNIPEDGEAARALLTLKLSGVKIESAVESFEKMSGRIWTDGLSSDWFIFADGFPPSMFYLKLKRGMDVVFAIILLILTAPLMIVVAAIIKLNSAGPVIFKQERVGYRGSAFILYKFRSMVHDAETTTGPIWARSEDDRATPIGSFLRKWRLDELPQMVNVLRGEMSFIGPRPERPYFVNILRDSVPHYDLRHYVKPGISGWAQVMYQYGASIEDAHRKLQYDLYYSKNISLKLDLLIVFKTIKVMLTGKGAR